MLSSPLPMTRPRPPSQTRRPTGMSTGSPVRLRTQSHVARTRAPHSPTDAPPPYSRENTENRHSLNEIDDMLNVAGSVVRNRERELDAAALASRSLLEENRLMFAKREALLARLPISPHTPIASVERHSQRSSSWSTCSDDSDMEGTATPDASTTTPSHSIDLSPPAAKLAPTQSERLAALHAGLVSPSPRPRPVPSSTRRVSVSPAAVITLQEANTALLMRVQELEETTAKAQTDGAARMRRLQAEAEGLRARLGEAEQANEGLRTEAEKQRVRAQSVQSRRPVRTEENEQDGPGDFAPGATWRPEFRSLRGGTRPIPVRATTSATLSKGSRVAPGSVRAMSSAAAPNPAPTPTSTPVKPRTARAQSIVPPVLPRPGGSPMKHTPKRPSMLRHQRANSYAGLSSVQNDLEHARRVVSTVAEELTDVEGTSPKPGGSPKVVTSPLEEIKPSPTQLSGGMLPFPSLEVEAGEGMDTKLLAQELVSKINELRATNEDILHQRDHLKEMLQAAEAEAEELKRVCERLEHEVELERSGGGSEGELSEGRKRAQQTRGVPGLQLEIPNEMEPASWTGSVKGRKKGAGLVELAAELGAELQDDGNVTDAETRPILDLASELMSASLADGSKPTTPTQTSFSALGVSQSPPAPQSRQASSTSTKPTPASTRRALGNRGMASRAKTNPRRVRKSLSSVVFASGGKALPSPVSSPTTMTTADSPVTPARQKDDEEEFVTPQSEFVTPIQSSSQYTFPSMSQQEMYLTPASTLRVPGNMGRKFTLPGGAPLTDDEDLDPSPARSRQDSTMDQLRAGLDPLFDGVLLGQTGLANKPSPALAPRRKPSNARLVFSKDEPLEPWEAKIRDLYSEIRALELDDPGMSSAGEDNWRGSRRARALGRMSLRRRVADGTMSDYAADDSEVGDSVARRRQHQEQEDKIKRFDLARQLQQKSMSTFLDVLLIVQFAVVLVVFVYTAVRRGPRAVLGTNNRRV